MVLPLILPASALLELATLPVGVQVLPTHTGKVVNEPPTEHLVIPLPVNPASHVTMAVCPVVPLILSGAALFELAILPVGVQVLTTHEGTFVNIP